MRNQAYNAMQSQTMFRRSSFLAFSTAIGFIMLCSPTAPAQVAVNSNEVDGGCPEEPKLRKKPRQVRDLTSWVMLVSQLEIQGGGNFNLRYERPETSCEKDLIDLDHGPAMVTYSPFQTGLESLLYRIVNEDGSDVREILVLYASIVSAVRDRGNHFYIAESRGMRTNFYAMFTDQPRFDAIKQLLTDILNDKATTLIVIEWSNGTDEPLIVEIDKKLK